MTSQACFYAQPYTIENGLYPTWLHSLSRVGIAAVDLHLKIYTKLPAAYAAPATHMLGHPGWGGVETGVVIVMPVHGPNRATMEWAMYLSFMLELFSLIDPLTDWCLYVFMAIILPWYRQTYRTNNMPSYTTGDILSRRTSSWALDLSRWRPQNDCIAETYDDFEFFLQKPFQKSLFQLEQVCRKTFRQTFS